MPTANVSGISRCATLVTLAALCLVATSAQAARLTVDPNQSYLTIGGKIDASSVGGAGFANLVKQAQAAGSLTASYSGWVDVGFQPGTIQLLPGSNMLAATTGNWAPADLGPGNDPVGGSSPASYGIAIPQLGAFAQYNTLRLDFGAPAYALPSTPMALGGGGTFNLAGQAMSFTTGRYAIVSGIGNGEDDVVGFPTVFGTSAADVGSWDGTTLIIPVHSTVTYTLQASPAIYDTITFTGQIVAVIPEPSTMIMAGLGVVGLVTVGYRSRKRKA